MDLIWKVLIVLAGVCLLGLGAIEVFSPSPYENIPTAVIDSPEMDVDEKTGWYLFDDDGYRMVTWSAKGGLTINRFDSLAQSRLRPKSRDMYIWERRAGDLEVAFQRDVMGRITGFSWVEADGKQRHAERTTDQGYHQEEVQFYSNEIRLSGLLLVPNSDVPFPAVVFIHGSGESDRDSFWYLYQAHILVSSGIAVLLPDKRGCGKSEGIWHTMNFETLAEDAVAGLRLLSQVTSVDSTRLGLVGFSQGGWIAPIAAQQSALAKFVVDVSGGAVTPNRQIAHEVEQDMVQAGVPSPVIDIVHSLYVRRAKKRFPEFWEKNGEFDPLPLWRQLRVPLLFIYGEKDEDDNTPVKESVSNLEILRAEKTKTLDIKVYKESGHALGDPATGWIRQEYLDNLVAWIKNAQNK